MDVIRPQPGPQSVFLATSADLAIYGGAAGGGKSFALLVEPLRHVHREGFGAVIFRRTSTQVRNEGSLWDESQNIYPMIGGTPREYLLEWQFPSGAKVKFAHLEHDSTKLNWQGSQIALIGFDELTHFEEGQFWYLLSRNRSTCGIKPYIRATTNPVSEDDKIGGWVARLISWWIDPETGYAIPERSGVIRYFIRLNNQIEWADDPQTLRDKFGDEVEPKSLTFIAANLDDNPALLARDPGYRANLMALPTVERERLLGGNWKIRPTAGMFFKVDQIQIVDALPRDLRYCRAWDLAATSGKSSDYTVGGKLGVNPQKRFIIADVVRGRWLPDDRDARLRQTTELDGKSCDVHLPQDPGQAGVQQAQQLTRMLAGYSVRAERVTGGKGSRAVGFASQVNAGNVAMLRAPWNSALIAELDAFTGDDNTGHDDQVDALSDAFNVLCRGAGPVTWFTEVDE